MGGSHGHGSGGPTARAHPRAHAVMLAVLAPLLVATVVGLVLLWPSPDEADEALARLPASGAELQESGVVRSTVEGTCEGGTPEDRLPDGTIPDVVPCATAAVEILSGADAGTVVEIQVPFQAYEAGLPDGTRVVLVRFPPAAPTGDGTGGDDGSGGDGTGVGGTGAPAGDAPDVGPSGDVYVWGDFARGAPLSLLAIAFAVLVVAVGRLRGLAAIAGLGLTYATIALFLLPALRAGSDAVLVAVCSAVVIMTVVLYLAHGFSARTTAALLGTVLGLLFSAGLAVWATGAARLGGVSGEETYTLSLLIGSADLSGILQAGIIIAVLGVLNDVTITQVSAVWEVHGHAPTLRFGELFRTGMRIGRDHLASTVYTIALAYAGAALPTLILIDIYGQPLGQVLTSMAVAEEIARTLVGSIGLVLAIPATTAIAAAAVAPPGFLRLRSQARRPDTLPGGAQSLAPRPNPHVVASAPPSGSPPPAPPPPQPPPPAPPMRRPRGRDRRAPVDYYRDSR